MLYCGACVPWDAIPLYDSVRTSFWMQHNVSGFDHKSPRDRLIKRYHTIFGAPLKSSELAQRAEVARPREIQSHTNGVSAEQTSFESLAQSAQNGTMAILISVYFSVLLLFGMLTQISATQLKVCSRVLGIMRPVTISRTSFLSRICILESQFLCMAKGN